MTEELYKPKNPKNRIDLENGNYCPPHRMGEGWIGLTIRGKSINNEPCHIHESRLSMLLHHSPFCLMIGCPNYESMRKAERKYRKERK